jgi:hypothetical protein
MIYWRLALGATVNGADTSYHGTAGGTSLPVAERLGGRHVATVV